MVATNLLKAAAAALMLSGAASALAQTQPAQGQTAAQQQDPNEVVCQRIKELGSRLSVKKVCMTRSEWAARKHEDRQHTEKIQVQRGYPGNP